MLELFPQYDQCLRVEVIPEIGYWFNAAAVVLMLLCGFDGSPTAKWLHRRLYRDDPTPPPNCVCVESEIK